MAKKDPKIVLSATDKTKPAFKSAQENMRNLASSAAVLEGPLGGIAGRLNAVGAAFGRINPALLAAGVGISALGAGLFKATRYAIQFETQMAALEGVVKATGANAGFTAANLNKIAEQTAKDTLASTADARKAVTILAQYRNIQGATLEQALQLSQDISATYGVGLVRSAQLLGRALNQPLIGLESLNTKLQIYSREEIRAAKESGELNKILTTQADILERVSKSVGGIAKTQADTISGKEDYTAQLHEELALQSNLSKYYGPVVSAYNSLLKGVIFTLQKRNDLEQHLLENGQETSKRLTKINKDTKEQIALDKEVADKQKITLLLEDGFVISKKALNNLQKEANSLIKSATKATDERFKAEKKLEALRFSLLSPREKLGSEFAKSAQTVEGASPKDATAIKLAAQEKFFEGITQLDDQDLNRKISLNNQKLALERSFASEKEKIDLDARQVSLNIALNEIFTEKEKQESILTVYQNAADKKAAIDKRASDNLARHGLASARSLGNNLNRVMEATGAEGTAIAKSIFLAQKAIDVVSIISATEVAAAKASAVAAAGGPLSFFATAGAIRTFGYANAAIVAGLGVNSALSGGGGATASAPELAPQPFLQDDVGGGNSGPVVTVNVYGNFYGDTALDDLVRDSLVANLDSNNINLQTDSGQPIVVNP